MVDHEIKIHELFHLEETIVSADEERDERCLVCGKPLVSGVTAYRSRDCPALFHDKCTKLPTPITNHSLHPNHTFHLVLQQPPYITLHCMFCFNRISGKFAYRCAVEDCHLILDTNCATLPKFTAASAPQLQVQHCSHEHPLVFIDEDVDEALKRRCNACWKSVAGGPFHGCLRCGFWLHRKCFDLPQKISHPSHRKHPLMLIAASSARPYPQGLRICDMCNYPIYEPLLFYHCRFCSFDVHVACISLPRIFTSLAHPDHPLHLLRRKCGFLCDWTGDRIEGAPYTCTESNLVLRKQFVETPYSLTITHHHHKVVHTFSTMTELEPDHKVECHICGDELNPRYGHYACPDQSCDYVAHLMCAWHRSVNKLQVMHENVLNLEQSSLPADPSASLSSSSSPSSSSSTPSSSSNLRASLLDESTHGKVEHLAKILPFEIVGEGLTRSTVLLMQHVLHRHLLCRVQRINPDDADDIRCFACCLQITDVSSTIFTCIGPCQFFLHETCAFMPPKLKHWIHPHTLTLGYKQTIICRACKYESGGLYYICDPCGFTICLCCTKISDVLEHPGHIHKLFFDTRIDQIHTCNACGNPCGASIIATNPFAFTCGKCEFYVDHSCLILPEITRHAYHDHVLTLSFKDDESNLSNIVCNICEEDRDPHHWFYVCKDCELTPSDFKAHPKCVLGKHPFIPIGMHTFFSPAVHEHGLKTSNVSYYPECGQCKQVIEDDIAAVCQEPDCSFTAHWECTCNSKAILQL